MTDFYSTVRPQLDDGDIIVLRGRDSLLAKATRLLLDTPYTHASIVLRLDGGVFVSEMWREGGPVQVPLSQYKFDDWDAFHCPVDRGVIRKTILEHMRDEIRYDYRDLLKIAANKNLGVPLPEQDDDRMVCSAYVGHVLLETGLWRPKNLPPIAAPSDIVDALNVPAFIRYRGYHRRKKHAV